MATRESEVAGGCTTRERFVWSTEEDSALSAYQRKVLRDNKIARMLEEMRATLRHFHKDSSVGSMLESTRSSGYSSMGEAALTPPPLTASSHHTLTHHLFTDGAQSHKSLFGLTEQAASIFPSSVPPSPSLSGGSKDETETTGVSSIMSSGDTLLSDQSSLIYDTNAAIYTNSAALIQDEPDSDANSLQDSTVLDSDSAASTAQSARTIAVIRDLKRRSDMWHAPNAVIRSESVTVRLKQSRVEAIKKQSIIEELLQEAGNQLSIQQQASSALHQCQRRGLPEEIEAERLILLAGERYKTFQQAAVGLVLSEQPLSKDGVEPCTATLYLSDIRIRFSENRAKLKEGKMEHFVCILRERETQGITATQLLSCQTPPTLLEFSNRFTLPEIPHNFQLSLEIYRMVCHAPHLRRRALSHVIHSARKLSSRKHKRPCFTCTARPVSIVLEGGSLKFEDALESQFQFACRVTITREMLIHTAYTFEEGSAAVGMEGLEVVVFADPNIGSSGPAVNGYLSIFRGVWERKWVALSETKLYCWRYPDQPANRERAEESFDVAHSRGLAEPASSETCAWKHSFSVPIGSGSSVLLLSADGATEMQRWVEAVNLAIISSATWRPGQ